jgi:hypothetical protein
MVTATRSLKSEQNLVTGATFTIATDITIYALLNSSDLARKVKNCLN